MDIDALNRTENFAVKTSDAMLRVPDHGNQLSVCLFHMDHIRRADRITELAASAFVEVDVDNHLQFTGIQQQILDFGF